VQCSTILKRREEKWQNRSQREEKEAAATE